MCPGGQCEIGKNFRAEIGVVILVSRDAGEIVIELEMPKHGAFLLKINHVEQVEATFVLAWVSGVFHGVAILVHEDAFQLMDGTFEVVLNRRIGWCLA